MDISFSSLLFEFGLIQNESTTFARFQTFSTFWQYFHFYSKCSWWSPYKLTSKIYSFDADQIALSANQVYLPTVLANQKPCNE